MVSQAKCLSDPTYSQRVIKPKDLKRFKLNSFVYVGFLWFFFEVMHQKGKILFNKFQKKYKMKSG